MKRSVEFRTPQPWDSWGVPWANGATIFLEATDVDP